MKFHSLKAKIILLVFLCIFLLSTASALFAYISLTRILNESIASKMNLLCESEGKKTDQMFVRIEDAVNNIAILLENKFERPEMARDAVYRKKILEEADSLFFAMANSMDGVVSHYVSFNPDLIDGIDGFIYRLDKRGVLAPVELTDIRAYAPSDIEHVGWSFSCPRACCCSMMDSPPMPLDRITPVRSGAAETSSPLSARASAAAARANWAKRATLRTSRRSRTPLGSKSLTSAARVQGRAEGSNWVMGPMPQRPSRAAAQLSAAVRPRGLTMPRPVITTLRFSM